MTFKINIQKNHIFFKGKNTFTIIKLKKVI